MVAVPGLMAKDGAEGVLAAALPDGRAVALKLADGSWRGFAAVLLAALDSWASTPRCVGAALPPGPGRRAARRRGPRRAVLSLTAIS